MKKKIIIFMVAIFILSFSLSPMVYASTTENMKAYYIIDDNGYIVDLVYLIKQDGVDYSNYIEIEPIGFKIPRWNGTEWVETYIAPTPIPTPIPPEPEDDLNSIDTSKTLTTVASETNVSLTAYNILLDTGTSYNINLNNTEENCKYLWTSSNENIVTVNPNNGIIKGIKKGNAIITCKITNSDNEVTKLKSDVTVGVDEDNFPTLSDTSIDLSVGDKYDLNIINKVVNSTYKFKSNDKSIVKINIASGKLQALKAGNVTITCEVTTSKKTVIILNCNISVE